MTEQTENQTEVVTESKQAMVVAFLKTDAAAGMTNPQIAAQFGCNEGTVRRSRKIVEAESTAHQMIARGVDGDEATATLKAILAASDFIDQLHDALAECKEEEKEIKASIKDAIEQERAVRRKAMEGFPLFDRGPRLALPA